MLRKIGLVALLVGALALAACGQAATPGTGSNTAETLNVVATTTLVADVVQQVGGDTVAVSTLIPVGADAHSFDPTPQDVARVADADLLFINGAGYEEFLSSMLANVGGEVQVIDLSEGIALRELSEGEGHADEEHGEGDAHAEDEEHSEGDAHAEGEEHTEGDAHAEDEEHSEGDAHAEDEEHSEGDAHAEEMAGLDPHTWTDPNNVKYWVEAISRSLSAADAANAATYEANAAAYTQQLNELDSWIGEQVAQLPADKRRLVTDHAVFGYFADRYGFEQIGSVIPSFSSAAQPSAQELAALQDQITDLGITTIFVGDVVNPTVSQRLADDSGAQVVTVLTESVSDEAPSYLDYMRYNVEQFVNALK
jgi:ABC-type Zn uptake system ZnuABC Zn-binding protein ZnuA